MCDWDQELDLQKGDATWRNTSDNLSGIEHIGAHIMDSWSFWVGK